MITAMPLQRGRGAKPLPAESTFVVIEFEMEGKHGFVFELVTAIAFNPTGCFGIVELEVSLV